MVLSHAGAVFEELQPVGSPRGLFYEGWHPTGETSHGAGAESDNGGVAEMNHGLTTAPISLHYSGGRQQKN